MIVPMKKVNIVVQLKDAADTVSRLGRLGVLHIEHQRSPVNKDTAVTQDELTLLDQAIGILAQQGVDDHSAPPDSRQMGDWVFIAKHIIELRKRLGQLEDYQRSLLLSIKDWQGWGDFDPQNIAALSEKNIFIKLYRIPVKEIKHFPSELTIREFGKKGGMVNCAVISRRQIEIPFKELKLPKFSLRQMQERIKEDKLVIEWVKKDLKEHTYFRKTLLDTRGALLNQFEFQKALAGMGTSGELSYITGYSPVDATDSLMQAAADHKWAVLITEPAEDDRVPTLIRNPRWVSIIAPVFKLIDITPGYRELDISLWFLLFLSVFFGMLIGDAGYGLIFLLLTLLAQKKLGKKLANKSIFLLFYIFSLCAVVWGVLSGTFFGQAWLSAYSIKPLVPALRDNKSLQSICFLIGAIHLSIGHLWRMILKLPSPRSLADAGWVTVLWGAYFLARTLILGEAFPVYAKWLIAAGVVSIVFFTSPSRNLLKGAARGFGQLLLNLVNTFTDLVSYIRLFAVGLATVAVADAFNSMAAQVGFNSLLSGLAAALILFIGHAFNIILGPMAVLVHGVRLNVLEFCNHVDVKWSGFSYDPLSIERYS